ncbi:MAG: hypothetical protein ACOC56_02340 [Atribacterota bacterium]
MKKIRIEIRMNDCDDKIATAIQTEGYNKESITDQFEILGIFENLKNQQQEKVETLFRQSKTL